MPTATCDLCGTLQPRALLRPETYQAWDALCPPCWLLATAHTTLERARADATRKAAHFCA